VSSRKIATHIIGLTAAEGGILRSPAQSDADRAAACAAVAARYRQIADGGWLLARSAQPGHGGARDLLRDPGRWFDFDELAQDGGYVFLETHSRYMDLPSAAVYGWHFDAERLVSLGALVCAGDLGGEYDDIIYAACEEVAAALPRLEAVRDEELALFAEQMSKMDADLLSHLQSESTDPTDALYDAVRGNEPSDPVPAEAVEQARQLIAERIASLQRERRVTGIAALKLLATGQHCEILVPEQLNLDEAIAVIEAGVVQWV
jgi:hypothetical protein